MENTQPTHTPGPWKVRAATFCDDGIPSYEVVMPGEPQMNALDARLIGRAPDLFIAAKVALDFIVDDNPGGSVADGWIAKICDDLRDALDLSYKPVASATGDNNQTQEQSGV